MTIIDKIIRDVCELPGDADPERDDVLVLRESDLRAILESHIGEREAPELLSVLSELVGYIDREGPPAKEWQAISALCDQAHAAIAKATGAA